MKKSLLTIFSLIFLICAPLNLWAKDALVMDRCGLLSDTQASVLQLKSESLARKYNCGVYIGIVPDMSDNTMTFPDAYGVQAYAQYFFAEYCGGFGDTGNGILLLLSMEERDYDLAAHGDFGNYAFTDYGKSVLEKSFLKYFSNDDWNAGFTSYLEEVGRFLDAAAQGSPIDIAPAKKAHNLPVAIIVGLIVGIIVASIVCSSLSRSMKSVRAAAIASGFLADNALNFTGKNDVFTHNTVVRQHIENANANQNPKGGTTINSSGYSHRSGKF